MKNKIATFGTLGLMVLAFVVFTAPNIIIGIAYATTTGTFTTTTTSTPSIIGYNIPDANHITNGIEGLIIPLFFAEMFALMLRYFKSIGDFHVTVFLLGIALGSLVLLYNVSGNVAQNAVPLAFVMVCWMIFGAWLWIGGQGEGSLATGGAG